jgi:signal transduction histidine kinase
LDNDAPHQTAGLKLVPGSHGRLERLLAVGRALVSELEPEAVLERILSEAREITGARFAALGVLDERRLELERFLTSGIAPEARRAIGSLPKGRGVLGALIRDPRPLRLTDVGAHPESYGFPTGHPPMRSFLGVPIVIRGQAWGNLYLTEKAGGEFSSEDEQAAVSLAQFAAVAIENARVHAASERRRVEAERAVRALEASRDIAQAIGNVDELERVLELITKRGRALVDARALLILLRDGDDLVVAAQAGRARGARGRRIAIAGSTSGEVLASARPLRIADAEHQLQVSPAQLGVAGARSALLVPMPHRGVAIGVLAAFDRARSGGEFDAEDEQVLETFAQSAANAVAMRRSVEIDRLRTAISAADAERGRWARELHDQTLQTLGGLRVLLATSLGRGDDDARQEAIRQAIADIELEIANLRQIITNLRPALLDDLGLAAAVGALVERHRSAGLQIDTDLRLDGIAGRLPSELETAAYRIVQEALTNVAKHSQASAVQVSIAADDSELLVNVRDDGIGFDTARREGFGLAGIQERVVLAGGRLSLRSGREGTHLSAALPIAVMGAQVIALRASPASAIT